MDKVRFAKDPNFVTRCIGGETILVPIRNHVADLQSIYNLNEMGTKIWELIDDQTDIQQITKAVVNEYEVNEDQAERDTQDFLKELESAGLIRPCKP